MSAIQTLTPHMADYQDRFSDFGEINWLPYVMYFHPFSHYSETVSTDANGFRYTKARGERYAVADMPDNAPVRVIAGSSTVFGIGASSDAHTLAARLTQNDTRPERWVNFGGRSFNSTQEMILFSLELHRLPSIKEIVLFSGFNNLGLARLPQHLRGEHGGFFMGKTYNELISQDSGRGWFGRRKPKPRGIKPDLETQIAYAADLTARHLAVWKALADAKSAKLTFVLQPLSNWLRQSGSSEEERIFAELEAKGRFAQAYANILTDQAHKAYSRTLKKRATELGVSYLDFAEHLRPQVRASDWLYVDRIHFTDFGHDIAAQTLLRALK